MHGNFGQDRRKKTAFDEPVCHPAITPLPEYSMVYQAPGSICLYRENVTGRGAVGIELAIGPNELALGGGNATPAVHNGANAA